MADNDKTATDHETKAGLMNKYKGEIKSADDANAAANEVQTNKTVEEKLPKTTKHSTDESGRREGLH